MCGASRLDAGRTTYDYEDVPLPLVFAELAAITDPMAGGKRVRFAPVLPPSPPLVVRADRRKLCQILVNLVSNAVKSSRRGACVKVSASTASSIPCAPASRPGRRPAAGPTGSLGLGLYIAERIVSAHGGRIDVESTEERGTTFTVHLPRG